MIYLIAFITALGLVINLLLVLFWVRRFKSYTPHKKMPYVSVLIAARNEEYNILNCIESLLNQKYPAHKYEILIGNDNSEDDTSKISRRLAGLHKNIKVYDITASLGLAKGKANVLAQLVHHAKGEYFLITDADITVNEEWIISMVSRVDKNTGIVNGFTLVKNNLMQHYEWTHALGMVKVLHDLGQPVTAIGNNMLVTKEAYLSTGGYENLPFSITEDYALFKAVKKNGFGMKQVVDKDVLAFSKPAGSLKNLLRQRKRWMTGAVQLPWFVVLILLLEGLYYPFIIAGFFITPVVALYIFVSKLLFQSVFIKLVLKKVDLSLKGGLLLYEIYAAFITILSMLYYLWPGKIVWKGRKYEK